MLINYNKTIMGALTQEVQLLLQDACANIEEGLVHMGSS